MIFHNVWSAAFWGFIKVPDRFLIGHEDLWRVFDSKLLASEVIDPKCTDLFGKMKSIRLR